MTYQAVIINGSTLIRIPNILHDWEDALSRIGDFAVMRFVAMSGNWFEEGGFVGRLCYLCRCFPFAGVIMPVRSGGF